jgi:hypothetical protein
MYDEPSPTSTARLLGSYWLDGHSWQARQPCCCFTPPPRRRVRGALIARGVLSVTSYALVLAALALIVAG